MKSGASYFSVLFIPCHLCVYTFSNRQLSLRSARTSRLLYFTWHSDIRYTDDKQYFSVHCALWMLIN